MANNKGMTRGLKTAILIIIVLLLLAGAIVGGIVILGNHSTELPDGVRTERLATPQNVKISDDWILSFDSVEGAVDYQVTIDGGPKIFVKAEDDSLWDINDGKVSINMNDFISNPNDFNSEYKLHTFKVRAKHSSDSNLDSLESALATKAKYCYLAIPENTSLSATLFSWGRVDMAISYMLKLTNDKGVETFQQTSSANTRFDLEQYLTDNPTIKWFDVQVCASALNISTGQVYNEFIKDSDYTTALRYTKASTVTAPVLAKGFADDSFMTDTHYISWVIPSDNEYIDHYEVWLDDNFNTRPITTITRAQFAGMPQYNLDLSGSLAVNLGNHEIYVVCVVKDEYQIASMSSNIISYTIYKQLGQVDSSSIEIGKIGTNLFIEWDEVESAEYYEIELQGKTSANTNFAQFQTIGDVKDTSRTISLEDMGAFYCDVLARVRAIGLCDSIQSESKKGFTITGEWSTISESCSTVTKLNSLSKINVISGEDRSDGTALLSWDSTQGSDPYWNYIGAFRVQIYPITNSSGQITRGDVVASVDVEKTKTELVISSILSTQITSGTYIATVTTVPASSEVGKYYEQSEPKETGIFVCKARLASPSGISVTRDKTDNTKLTMTFFGVEQAKSYHVTIRSEEKEDVSPEVIEFDISQPETFNAKQAITDKELITSYMGSKTQPKTYKISMYAVPNEDETLLMNSLSSLEYTYDDMFTHAKVTNIQFTQIDNNLQFSWVGVSTAAEKAGYEWRLYSVSVNTQGQEVLTKIVGGDATDCFVTVSTEDVLKNPGVYKFSVECKNIASHYNPSGEAFTDSFTYYHYINLTTEAMSFVYNKDEDDNETIRISIPNVDPLVTGYAIKFDDDTPLPMTINSDGTVSYDATFEKLPLYITKNVTILAGVKISDDGSSVVMESNQPVKQDYMKQIATMSQTFTNDFVAEGVTITHSEDTETQRHSITFTLAEGASARTKSVTWEVWLNGRLYYSTKIDSDIEQIWTTNLNKTLAGSESSALPVGKYIISAVVEYQSGLKSNTSSCEPFEIKSNMAEIQGLTVDETGFAYIQWNKVKDAVSYTVKVLRNADANAGPEDSSWTSSEEINLSFPYNELTVGETSVLRVSTVELFNTYGGGTYRFIVSANSEDAYISPSSATKDWQIAYELPAPTVEIMTNSDNSVYARITTSNLASSYRVVVVGVAAQSDGSYTDYTVTQNSGSSTYVNVPLDVVSDKAGTFLVRVYAEPYASSNRQESAPTIKEFTHTITANKPTGLAVTQIDDGINLSWTEVSYLIWTVTTDENGQKTATRTSVTQKLAFTVSTAVDNIYYKNGDVNVEIVADTATGTEFTSASDDAKVTGLIKFLNDQLQSTYLVYCVSRFEGEFINDSTQAVVRLAYQATLPKPTLALDDPNQKRLVEDSSIVFKITDLASQSSGVVDVKIEGNGKTLNLDAQALTKNDDGSYTFTLKSTEFVKEGLECGEYKVSVRACQNGIYKASAYSDAVTINYATKVGEVSGIVVTQTSQPATEEGGSPTYRLNISFNELTVACDYTVTMTYNSVATVYTFTKDTSVTDKISYYYDYSDDEALQIAWGTDLLNNDLILNFSITATPKNTTEVLTNTTYYEAQTTSYTYQMDKVSAPTNIQFSQSGTTITVTWVSDANYADTNTYTTKYTVEVTYTDNNGTLKPVSSSDLTITDNANSCSFPVASEDAVYLIKFDIKMISVVKKSDGSSAASLGGTVGDVTTSAVVAYWVNTKNTGEARYAEISYNPTLSSDSSKYGTYTVTFTHTTGNGTLFTGQSYNLFVDGAEIKGSAENNDNTVTITITDESAIERLINIANRNNSDVSYKIVISDAVLNETYSTTAGKTFVGFKGRTCSGNFATMPIVITQAPNVTIDTTNTTAKATWDAVTHATQYKFLIKDANGNIVATSEQTITSSGATLTHDFSTVWANLPGGKYTIEVSVENDSTSGVYATATAKFTSGEITKYDVMPTVSSLTFITYSNGQGDFKTDISWSYDLTYNLSGERFVVTLTSKATGDVTTLDSEYITPTQSGTNMKYTLTLSGRNLGSYSSETGYPLAGYDPTRELAIGEYTIGVKVLRDTTQDYSADSAVANPSSSYINKFGVAKVDASGIFNVAPECYVTVANGVLSVKDGYTADFTNYENQYKFNTKYLILSADGAKRNLATHYRVIVNDTDLGVVSNKGSGISFAEIQENANKLGLGSVWKAGKNTIVIRPTTTTANADYYYYIVKGTGSEADTAYEINDNDMFYLLNTTYTVEMYSKFNTPNNPTVQIGYNDDAKHNINKVNVTFGGTPDENSEYSVILHYKDYYDSNNEKTLDLCELNGNKPITLTYSTTAGGQKLQQGLVLYEYLEHLGPHEMWFEIRQTGLSTHSEEDSPYYVDSDAVTTTKFIYTTAVQEFSSKSADEGEREVSVVTAVNYSTETETYKNGTLMWTLPVHAYSIQVKYTVTLKDNAQSNPATFSTILSVTWDKTQGKLVYDLEENETSLFYISTDGKYLCFDMTNYFWNSSRSSFYIAGVYYYQIKAEAFDANGTAVKNRIYDPVSPYGQNEFVYQGIAYPNAPSAANINANGELLITYSAIYQDKHANSGVLFNIELTITKLNGDKKTTTIYNVGLEEIDLSSYLVAGGANCNAIKVYRVAPDEYYENSASVSATFADNYVVNSTMPSISAEWSGASTIDYQITEEATRLNKVLQELQDNDSTAQFEISILRIDVQSYASLANKSQTYDSIVALNQASLIEAKHTFTVPFTSEEIAKMLGGTSSKAFSFALVQTINALGDTSISGKFLTGDSKVIDGVYYVKVQFSTDHTYYNASTAYASHYAMEEWSILDEAKATMTGEFLTLKEKTADKGSPKSGDDRNWAEAEDKQAILSFDVKSNYGLDGKQHLPSTVNVKVVLNNSSKVVSFTKAYTLPDLTNWTSTTTSLTSEGGDVVVTRSTSPYYTVAIDIHAMFDDATNNDVPSFAGSYTLTWKIVGDDFGGESAWYEFNQDICHYTALQTPILDYRLDMIYDNEYRIVLNWGLTPNQYNYAVNDNADYNVNIFAFEQSNGSYACDTAYANLTNEQKATFLQNVKMGDTKTNGFALGQYVLSQQANDLNGRKCFINGKSGNEISLNANSTYKFFIYLSPTTSSSDKNASYYLTSMTSAPCEYVYKEITAKYTLNEMGIKTTQYMVEGQDGLKDVVGYKFSFNQSSTSTNSAFELFVYDTQDATAGTSKDWMTNQEETGKYLAHYIISTKNNASTDLYIITNYTNGKQMTSGYVYGKKVGYRDTNGNVVLDGLTLGELLGDKYNLPLTYYCKIKPWIDNNIINANALIDTDGYYQSIDVYSAEWVKKYVTTENVDAYANALTEKVITTKLADFNAMNPSYYFTFSHSLHFQTPTISKIEVINTTGGDDVVGECAISYPTTGTAYVTEGYIRANVDDNHYYKVYLDNVLTSQIEAQADKAIQLIATATRTRDSKSATFEIKYDEAKPYIIIATDTVASSLFGGSNGTGVQELFNFIENEWPNAVTFIAKAVKGASTNNAVQDAVNTGGANTADKFYQYDGKSTIDITRNFDESQNSDSVSLIVRKQYATPEITLMFDDFTSSTLLSTDYTSTMSGVKSNVPSGTDQIAYNPYLYVSEDDYNSNGAQSHEYDWLTSCEKTQYNVKFTYGSTSKTVSFKTNSINSLLGDDGNFVASINENKSKSRYEYYPFNYVASSMTGACLYEMLFDLVNKNVSDGSYHGGIVTMSISVSTSSNQDANYWVDSDISATTKFAFNIRLAQVTGLSIGDRTFYDENGEYHLATIDQKFDKFYYYEGYIPLSYTAITQDAKYRVVVSRTSPSTLVYDASNSNAEWTASVKNVENIGNLAKILATDLAPSNVSQNQLYKYNQWDTEYTWSVKMYACPDTTASAQDFITRGFDSEIVKYTPKLKLVNDIASISIETKISNNTIQDITYNWTSNQNSEKRNLGASHLWFGYESSSGSNTYTYDSEYKYELALDDKAYENAIQSFIKDKFGNATGGDYKCSVYLTSEIEGIEDSEPYYFTYKHYRTLSAADFNLKVGQAKDSSGNWTNTINYSATIDNVYGVESLSVGLAQTVLGNSVASIAGQSPMSSTSSGSQKVFSGSSQFVQGSADCFSTTSFTTSETTKLTTQGYVSSSTNKGNIQAGKNYFRFYPTFNSSTAGNTLMNAQGYIEASCDFIVPKSYSPTVSLSNTTSSEGGGSTRKSSSTTVSCATRVYTGSSQVLDESVDCSSCSGTGSVRCSANCTQLNPSTSPPGCRPYWGTYGTYSACSNCSGRGYTTTSTTTYGSHTVKYYNPSSISFSTGYYYCTKCSATCDDITQGDEYKAFCNETCSANKTTTTTKTNCSNCSGQGFFVYPCSTCGGSGTITCSTCKGKGHPTKTVSNYTTCSLCGGSGSRTVTTYYTYNYAKYVYVTGLKASFTNATGCSVQGNWTYGWKSNGCSSCTKTVCNYSGSSTNIATLTSGITFSNKNYATFTVTVKCKDGFANYFEKSSATATISPNYVSSHYEAYTS